MSRWTPELNQKVAKNDMVKVLDWPVSYSTETNEVFDDIQGKVTYILVNAFT